MTTAQTDNDFAFATAQRQNPVLEFLFSSHQFELSEYRKCAGRVGGEISLVFPRFLIVVDSALDILTKITKGEQTGSIEPLSCPELRLNHVNLRIRAGHGGMHHLQSSRPVPNTEGNSSILVLSFFSC
jgi:hypothetical protein